MSGGERPKGPTARPPRGEAMGRGRPPGGRRGLCPAPRPAHPPTRLHTGAAPGSALSSGPGSLRVQDAPACQPWPSADAPRSLPGSGPAFLGSLIHLSCTRYSPPAVGRGRAGRDRQRRGRAAPAGRGRHTNTALCACGAAGGSTGSLAACTGAGPELGCWGEGSKGRTGGLRSEREGRGCTEK